MPARPLAERPTFTVEEYERHARHFAKVPARWKDSDAPGSLAALREHGGAGLVAIVPFLLYGYHAYATKGQPFICSQEKLSRLCKVSVESVAHARAGGTRLGLFTAAPERYKGQDVVTWRFDVSDAHPFASPPGTGAGRDTHCFYFPLTLVYGGQWARLSRTQQALYLAVGLYARPYSESFDRIALIDDIAPGTPLDDIAACAAWVADANARDDATGRATTDRRRHAVRLACVSQSELARTTGLHVNALSKHLRALRAPGPWPGTGGEWPSWWRADEQADAEYAPLRVYPSASGGSQIYHLRDHAPPWLHASRATRDHNGADNTRMAPGSRRALAAAAAAAGSGFEFDDRAAADDLPF